ncbi:biopolymer transporter ExbD [Neptuniibacter sp. CAU 1671]|jgi:biopolymer transport protein ExbD|uniref:ExbD/TolR family protein n=1 Tax=Neptuniibacter sp. CAU 1671 TaxID=3032593 RepID=UPI0023DA4913|nr:biopolymer transporter ExbD [Neptuniibacter sp. CAU 1671]MDF2182814.1 biopolymer transporter ExbD [Neptuniibacter sp. CAU 1671]
MIQQPSPVRDSLGNDDNLIPLINVVFLMLIFFMVAGHIEASDAARVELPNSKAEQASAQQRHELLIDATGNRYLNGQPVTEAEMIQQLSQIAADSTSASQPMLVKADALLPVSQLQDHLRQLHAAGLQKITLATRLVTGSAQ